MKKVFNIFAQCVVVFILFVIGLIIVINRPHRIGKTNYYFKWFDDYRCISFIDPDSKINMGGPLGVEIITCEDAYYDDDYIITYDALLDHFYIIRIARNRKEYHNFRGLAYKDINSFRRCLDSLRIDPEKMKYTIAPRSPFDARPTVINDFYDVIKK